MSILKPRYLRAVTAGVVLLAVGAGLWWWAEASSSHRDGRATAVGALLGALGVLLAVAGWFAPVPTRHIRKGNTQLAGRGSVQAGGNIAGPVATGTSSRAISTRAERQRTTQGSTATPVAAGDGQPLTQESGRGSVQALGAVHGPIATGRQAQSSEIAPTALAQSNEPTAP
jgi:hypothetical protein